MTITGIVVATTSAARITPLVAEATPNLPNSLIPVVVPVISSVSEDSMKPVKVLLATAAVGNINTAANPETGVPPAPRSMTADPKVASLVVDIAGVSVLPVRFIVPSIRIIS